MIESASAVLRYSPLPAITCSKLPIETRARCAICLNVTLKTPERRQWQWRRSAAFIVNFEHISHLFLVCLFLTLSR